MLEIGKTQDQQPPILRNGIGGGDPARFGLEGSRDAVLWWDRRIFRSTATQGRT
jgi:hypothetical protein